jgi:hypothetical protein
VTEHWCNHRAKKLRSGVTDIEITPGQLNVIKYIIIRHYIYIIERQRCGLWDKSVLSFTKKGKSGGL